MKAKHSVKIGGKWYRAGEEISPANNESKTTQQTTDGQSVNGGTNDGGQKSHTKTEINRMFVEDLKKLAAEQGVDGAEEMNGADLKKALIEKLGL